MMGAFCSRSSVPPPDVATTSLPPQVAILPRSRSEGDVEVITLQTHSEDETMSERGFVARRRLSDVNMESRPDDVMHGDQSSLASYSFSDNPGVVPEPFLQQSDNSLDASADLDSLLWQMDSSISRYMALDEKLKKRDRGSRSGCSRAPLPPLRLTGTGSCMSQENNMHGAPVMTGGAGGARGHGKIHPMQVVGDSCSLNINIPQASAKRKDWKDKCLTATTTRSPLRTQTPEEVTRVLRIDKAKHMVHRNTDGWQIPNTKISGFDAEKYRAANAPRSTDQVPQTFVLQGEQMNLQRAHHPAAASNRRKSAQENTAPKPSQPAQDTFVYDPSEEELMEAIEKELSPS